MNPQVVKFVVLSVFFVLLVVLGFALYYVFTNKGGSKKTAYALSLRVTITALLLLGVIIAAHIGWVRPHQIYDISR